MAHVYPKTFFDKAAFNITRQSDTDKLIPIVLDGESIKINNSACGIKQIEQQLGKSTKIDNLSDGSIVLLYNEVQLKNLREPTAN